MNLYVLIATIDNGLLQAVQVLLPRQEGVRYVVSWQQTRALDVGDAALVEAEKMLEGRTDVRLTKLEGRGLCRNRNHAIEVALDWLPDTLEDAVFIIADDDERFSPQAFEHIREAFERYPKMDGALWRMRSIHDGTYFKEYPPQMVAYGSHPRSYYPCSWEMTFRTRVWHMGIRFDERFGLGAADLCAGEEDVLLTDILRKGLKVVIVPEDIGRTEPITTGTHVLEPKVLRSKGGVYGYQRSLVGAFMRSVREALALGWHNRVNPWPLFRQLWYGVKYIRS